jgi:putative transposase
MLAERLQHLIVLYPTFGYRRLWALLRFGAGLKVNRKAIYRVLRLKGWFVHQRSVTPRPRVQGLRSRAQRSDERWANGCNPCTLRDGRVGAFNRRD